jgi:hypothetical protein
MEGGLINPIALIRTGAAKGVTSVRAAALESTGASAVGVTVTVV